MSSDGELSFSFLESHPRDAARVLEKLSPADSAAFLANAPARLSAPVLQYMLPLHAAGCLQHLEDDVAAGALHLLGVQPAVAIFRHLPEGRRAALAQQLPNAMAVAMRLLLGYATDTVGAWMEPFAVAVPAGFLCGDVLARLREADGEDTRVYVLDNAQRLRGSAGVNELLRAQAQQQVGAVMHAVTHVLPAQATVASIRHHPGWQEHRFLPVIERGDRFVGVLSYAVMTRASENEAGTKVEPMRATIEELGFVYWAGVSRLISSIVGCLPVDGPRREDAGKES